MKAFQSLIVALLLVLVTVTNTVYAADEYKELSIEQKMELLTETALEYDIPPEILKAIAWRETGMMQFKDGEPIVSNDGGIGMMQITNTDLTLDKEKLKTDTTYNVESAAKVLNSKWKLMSSGTLPKINGEMNRNIIEHWYFPIMAYNGVSAINDPEKVELTYQQEVFNYIRDNSLLKVASVPKMKFNYTEEGKLKFEELSYNWKGATTYTSQMFNEGDKVVVMNSLNINEEDYDYGNLRVGQSFSSNLLMKVPYYTELEIVSGPYFPSENINNHYVAYEVKGNGISGYMASANLRTTEINNTTFTPWETKKDNVTKEKEWTIKFDTTVHPSTINERNIYVTNENGVGMRTDVSIQSGGKSVKVVPQSKYESGQTYTLHIKNIKSKLYKEIKTPRTMTFTIQN